MEQNTQVRDIIPSEYGSDLVTAVETLRKDLKSAADLFQSLLAVLSGPDFEPFTFEFPIHDEVKEELLQLIAEFKTKTEETTNQTNAILAESRKDGFTGTDIVEAVHCIAEARKQEVRDQAFNEFNAELAQVIQNMENIHKAAERDKQRI